MLTYTDPHPVSSEELRRYKSFALHVSGLAGKITLPFFRAGVAVENKLDDGRFDPVTEADKGAERLIRDEIAKTFPDHGVFGEEFGLEEGNGLTWVIDPIDGTRAFMTGMLHWACCLRCLMAPNRCLVSCISRLPMNFLLAMVCRLSITTVAKYAICVYGGVKICRMQF